MSCIDSYGDNIGTKAPLAFTASIYKLAGGRTLIGPTLPIDDGASALQVGGSGKFDGSVQAGGNISNYGMLNVARYAGSPQSTITLGDGANPSNDVGIYFRQTVGVAGFSTAGAGFAWFNGSPGIGELLRLDEKHLLSQGAVVSIGGSRFGGATLSTTTPMLSM